VSDCVNKQWPDIARDVDGGKTNQGAGDQSKILGYANRQTKEHVLMTLALSQCVVENLNSK